MSVRRILPKIEPFTRVQVTSYMRIMLKMHKPWAHRALVIIWNQQTTSERKKHVSKGRDNKGFNRVDTPVLGHLACKLKQNHPLTDAEEERVLRCIPKYCEQVILLCDTRKLTAKLDEFYGAIPPDKEPPY